eukprot:GHRR01026661.1.p1 GENE.GHRR01026661.1~~GHRR01026661.1.p1  ORF type:complete len:159 (-),score=27.33 GHRR01026661.1:152-628(-)
MEGHGWLTQVCVLHHHFPLQELLDDAQAHLLEGAARLCMPVQMVRKTRSVGVIPTQPTIYEVSGSGIGQPVPWCWCICRAAGHESTSVNCGGRRQCWLLQYLRCHLIVCYNKPVACIPADCLVQFRSGIMLHHAGQQCCAVPTPPHFAAVQLQHLTNW